jgi:hypothetical protein
MVEVGLMWVQQQWSNLLKWHKGKPRLTPFDKTYDLHVNVPTGIWAPVSMIMCVEFSGRRSIADYRSSGYAKSVYSRAHVADISALS